MVRFAIAQHTLPNCFKIDYSRSGDQGLLLGVIHQAKVLGILPEQFPRHHIPRHQFEFYWFFVFDKSLEFANAGQACIEFRRHDALLCVKEYLHDLTGTLEDCVLGEGI